MALVVNVCRCGTVQSVVGDTARQPVLQLTDLVEGHYVFVLEVTDDAGQKSTSSASIVVKAGLY